MPKPPPPCSFEDMQDLLSQIKRDLIQEMQITSKVAQQESLEQQRLMITSILAQQTFSSQEMQPEVVVVSAEADQAFDLLDTNHDGSISRAELDTALQAGVVTNDGVLSRAFDVLDTNHDGVISRAEMDKAFQAGVITKDDTQEVCTEVSITKNGEAERESEIKEGRTSMIIERFGPAASWMLEQEHAVQMKLTQPDLYNTDSLCFKMTDHWFFHVVSLSMISFNAVYIGVEADWNHAETLGEATWGFQFCEHTFCLFFVSELILRFGAFKTAGRCLKDNWFVFDAVLVILMVIDTWIFSIVASYLEDPPNTGAIGGIGRMFRLLRLARISKLMHMIPELITMFKGMMAAVRAVHAALLILMLQVYVFAIVMTALIGPNNTDDRDYFPSVRDSMVTLLLSGVLLDDITGLVLFLIKERHVLAIIIFSFFVLLSAITVMNMLIGVLCEVVLDVSADETEAHIKEQMSKTLLVMLEQLDDDASGHLSRTEIMELMTEPEAVAVLNDIQVDTQHLLDLFDMLYAQEDTTLPIGVIMNIVLLLRGKRPSSMSDLAKGHNLMLWKFENKLASHQCKIIEVVQSMQESVTSLRNAEKRPLLYHMAKTP